MQRNKSKTLAQADLVAELCKLNRGVNERNVATWRKLGLLPNFDKTGRGRGRSAGRERSVWVRGDEVLNQATWIYDLRKMYRTFDALYLPLWMLGYPIPLECVREALARPLEAAVESIEMEIDGRDDIGIEDLIDDAVYQFTLDAQRGGMELFQPPREAIEAFMNLVFNSDYNLADPLFEEAVATLRNGSDALHNGRVGVPGDGSGTDIFAFAPFINRHLSLHRVKEAVDEATDDDLMAVWRDLSVLREMVRLFGRMMALLLADVPDGLKESFAEKLPALFFMGKLCILADLPLRRNGYGEWIDYVLPTALNRMREEFDEKMEQELSAASSQINMAIQSAFEQLTPKDFYGPKAFRNLALSE